MNQNNNDNIPLAPEQCVTGFGTTLIVAPHADDESLGCGGVISLLRKFGQNVYILLLSDGTLSHPNSKEYPAEKLRDLREKELLDAAEILGVPAANIVFCRYKDRNVPSVHQEGFENAVKSISKMMGMIQPQSIFVPWRRDPHPDHQAAFQLINASETSNAKIYEYPIWLKELGNEGDEPSQNESMPFRLNINSVLAQKQEAISKHRSQIDGLITDDPEGFQLSQEMLSQFNVPYETFFISK
ncbi:PIG-L deacetylase family protein [Chryseobacterium caseinilyticum]|uniref:PIG-L family deacetylase n=1 Tax=Chryseobacterium caseinilyticum TaxID=2771428 RepID=A0ABR8Z8L9_9FLAO|nr:PIG-L deacetylase family protein [Chryseobacterium caseinilyticum]MBD8081647.1 PIG-L family deacetylase [Chryseobacterium caseinilyticum]